MIPIKTQYPNYFLEIPSTKKQISFRPFIEKERKVLLMAAESESKEVIFDSIKNILTACCPEIDINALTIFDVEYIFLQLRSKSIGEMSGLNFRCDNILPNTKPCGHIMKIDIDLSQIKVENLIKDFKLKFTDNFGLKMKYPSINSIKSKYDDKTREYFYNVAANCIEFIYEGDNIYYMKDYSIEDQIEFIQSLTFSNIEKLEYFIDNLPSLKKKINHKCEKCGFDHEITLEGYQSFFI
jgi:T4 bacteriophage base plate protein